MKTSYNQVCSKCGSKDVARCKWVNVNTDEIYSADSGTSLEWCFGDCKDETRIIDEADFKKLVDEVVVMQDLLDNNSMDNMTVLDRDNICVTIGSKERIFHRSKYESVLDANNRAELYIARELDRAFELIDEVVNFPTEADEKAYDDFLEKYKPTPNQIDRNASYDGFMFETYGEELEFVEKANKKDPRTVWTILEADGVMYLSSGYHFVNRQGYMITENPYEGAELLEIKL